MLSTPQPAGEPAWSGSMTSSKWRQPKMIMWVSSTGTCQRVSAVVEWRSRAADGTSEPICR